MRRLSGSSEGERDHGELYVDVAKFIYLRVRISMLQVNSVMRTSTSKLSIAFFTKFLQRTRFWAVEDGAAAITIVDVLSTRASNVFSGPLKQGCGRPSG